MAPKKTGKIKKKSVTKLSNFLISDINIIPDININPLTIPLVKLEYYDGSAWYPLASESWVTANASGTVTGITAGTGLSGGTITTSGTIAIADTGVSSGTYNYPTGVSVNARGQLTAIVGGSAPVPYVSSVACIGSTGITVSGSPITSSGTLILTLGSDLQALSALSTTGLVARTGAATYLPRTITAGTGISVTNGNGVSGNPTVAVSSIDISTNTTGQIPISRLSGYPTSSNAFLRGDGLWVLPYVNNLNINGNVTFQTYNLTTSGSISATTGSLTANNLGSFNSSTLNVVTPLSFSSGGTEPIKITTSSTTSRIILDNTNNGATSTGLMVQQNGASAANFVFNSSANKALIWLYPLNSTLSFGTGNVERMTLTAGVLNVKGNTISEVNRLLGNEIEVEKIYVSTPNYYYHYYNYGYLNQGGNVGTASGSNVYSIVCNRRVAATEFNATSSKKIKHISKEPVNIDRLRKKFLSLDFKTYEYLDASDGSGESYGIIAEDLLQHFPQFVDERSKRYVPNCLQSMTLLEANKDTYLFSHAFDMDKIDPGSQKIRIIFGNTSIDVSIITLTPTEIEVRLDEKDIRQAKKETRKNYFFAYGTYETCPVVTKNKLFEVALILLQNMLREEETRELCSACISLKK